MRDFASISLSEQEFEDLVRLLGHHVSGPRLANLFNRLMDLSPRIAEEAAAKGSLCADSLPSSKLFYGNRPMVHIED